MRIQPRKQKVSLQFTVQKQDENSHARAGNLELNGELVQTPMFMPVGTRGSIKSLSSEDILTLDYNLILANTYHLYLKPGLKVLESFSGLKNFMSYNKALLTDSGGFQVFSLSSLFKLEENGVRFQSHIDGSRHTFTPKKVIDIQRTIGSDIMMVLDDCAPFGSDLARLQKGSETTLRWALESWNYYSEKPGKEHLFCINQGGTNLDLRKSNLESLQNLPYPGIAIGGLSVGEPREEFRRVLEGLAPNLDPNRPHYLMGVGTVSDILDGVKHGIDLFDCVLPTRNARNGQVFTKKGKINLRNEANKHKEGPIDPDCSCKVCKTYSLGYIRHLHNVKELTAFSLSTYHNLHFMKEFMGEIRKSIQENRFNEFYQEWKILYGV